MRPVSPRIGEVLANWRRGDPFAREEVMPVGCRGRQGITPPSLRSEGCGQIRQRGLPADKTFSPCASIRCLPLAKPRALFRNCRANGEDGNKAANKDRDTHSNKGPRT